MARIRTIKPEFFMHEELYDLEAETGLPVRLAFIGLWCQCDREGRFKWRPRTLRAQILPFDDVDFSRVLQALTTRGFIVNYASDGVDYGLIPTFATHQVLNNRESDSVLPAPDASALRKGTSTREARVEHATTTESQLCAVEGKGREGKGKEGKGRERNGRVWETTSAVSSEEAAETPSSGETPTVEDTSGVRHPVVAAWNAIADSEPMVAGVRKLTAKRASALRARCRDPDWQEAALGMIGDLPFAWQDRPAAIDWLLRPDTVLQWQEGRYKTDMSSPGERRTRAVLNSYLERRDGNNGSDGDGGLDGSDGGIFKIPDRVDSGGV